MKKVKFWASLAVAAAILLRPEAAVAGAQKAMHLWYTSVAPSLLPFLVLMPALTGKEACIVYNAVFSGIMRVFRLPGAAASAVVVGMIAGSPGGALAVRNTLDAEGLQRSEAARIALALAGVSPAFLIMGVGGMYGSVNLGVKLALIQTAVQLFMLFLLRNCSLAGLNTHPECMEKREGMAGTVGTLLVICGYMVFFSSIAGVAADLLGKHVGMLFLLSLDLPSGLAQLSGLQLPAKDLLLGMVIGFGGLCIAAQNMDVLRSIGVSWKEYLFARMLASCLNGCLSALALRKTVFQGWHRVSPGKTYAFAFLIATILLIPVLAKLSTQYFINKRNVPEMDA